MSIGLWDEHDGTLFCGDVVYAEDPLIDQAPTSDPEAYVATMRRCETSRSGSSTPATTGAWTAPRCTTYLERRDGVPLN